MKITGVRPWVVKSMESTEDAQGPLRYFIYVQVDTDEGLTGWGEITTYPGLVTNLALASIVQVLKFQTSRVTDLLK